ncbi:MAG: hypothetical protein ACI9C9_002165 [Marivirga sp.]|jgi:hypothetical protein
MTDIDNLTKQLIRFRDERDWASQLLLDTSF